MTRATIVRVARSSSGTAAWAKVNAAVYPDVLVTCNARDLAASLEMHHPKLIIEVRSPTSATFDRGDKFLTYRRIEALKEYAQVDPHDKSF